MIELDLSGNRIDKLHPHTFTGLEKLRVLDLSMNQLSRLDGVQFPPLPHLRKLYFRENKLNYIHNFAFSNLKLLDSLRLSGNQLKLVQPELFTNNTNLVELELHDNQWVCDCHLKNLVRWVKSRSLLQTHVTCHSPERVSGRKWEELSEYELACRPNLVVPQSQIPAALGQNASMTCRASGDPLPQLKWVLHGRVLTNMSIIPFSQPEQRYVVNEVVEGEERWTQLTVTHMSDHDFTYYTCVADNLAGLVEQNISLIPATPTLPGAISPKTGLDLYIIIAIAAGGLLLLILILILICCCLKKRKRHESKPRPKVNGVAGGNHIEHKNVLIVNPVEKPPRKYEKVPQTDLELMALNTDPGAHRNYDEVDYPEAGPASHRTPLATLEEEDDDLPSQDTTLPLDTTATPSHCALADYMAHYPDLLDMTRPRAVSPTQLSYHSLVAPQFTTPGDWRYSYTHPDYPHYPVAYAPPHQVQQRPGYVTLPRRHRSPSWAGHPSSVEPDSTSPPPASEDGKVVRLDPIYDTLGPRTTADGTSRTDLTRPALRAAEPFTPRTPQSPNSPPSLPPYYTPVNQSTQPGRLQSRNQSSTLPRSTPNLLDGNSGLSIPQHETPSSHLNARARLAAHSPTPSNASTVRTASPAYRTSSPVVSVSPQHHSPHQPPLNGHHATPSKNPLGSSNESTLDSSSQHNNNNNSVSGKNNVNKGDISLGSPGGPVIVATSGKKVPPKPPPKPNSKRLSVSSTTSDSRKASLGDNGRVFQDEGPDGTEV
ncbi:uncharacterized protein LOC121860742 [Homarus americanus]|uniref:uncharacterized protein LOC121860742 n=1 Tax=Homarus americanus TaxID=6706 RepID=UPI001C4696EB|nr:uncharacterized protein LOC121860742 [Homarus americanus]